MSERELFAAYAHTAWSGWMQYMIAKCQANKDGSVTIPYPYYHNLYRLMTTPYAELTEAEKEGDRDEADKILAIIARRAYDVLVSMDIPL